MLLQAFCSGNVRRFGSQLAACILKCVIFRGSATVVETNTVLLCVYLTCVTKVQTLPCVVRQG